MISLANEILRFLKFKEQIRRSKGSGRNEHEDFNKGLNRETAKMVLTNDLPKAPNTAARCCRNEMGTRIGRNYVLRR
jgi:hypothetical protein